MKRQDNLLKNVKSAENTNSNMKTSENITS